MLQWMGGSRRKVTTSRKSTQKRQKQYFEQRKRQQQEHDAVFTENNVEGSTSFDHQKRNRSLDISSLLNVSKVTEECKPSCGIVDLAESLPSMTNKANCRSSVKDVDSSHVRKPDGNAFSAGCHTLMTTPTRMLDQLTATECTVPTGTRASPLHQVGRLSSKSPRGSTSTGKTRESEYFKSDLSNQLSIFDIIGDDGAIGTVQEQAVQEAHVAFSIEGLGKVGIETPMQSPQHPGSALNVEQLSFIKDAKNFSTRKKFKTELDDLEMELDDKPPPHHGRLSFSSAGPELITFKDRMQLDGKQCKMKSLYDEDMHDNFWNDTSLHLLEYQVNEKCGVNRTRDDATNSSFWKNDSSDFKFENYYSSSPDTLSRCQEKIPDRLNSKDGDCLFSSLNKPKFSFVNNYYPKDDYFPVKLEDTRDNLTSFSGESCSSTAVVGESTADMSSARHSRRYGKGLDMPSKSNRVEDYDEGLWNTKASTLIKEEECKAPRKHMRSDFSHPKSAFLSRAHVNECEDYQLFEEDFPSKVNSQPRSFFAAFDKNQRYRVDSFGLDKYADFHRSDLHFDDYEKDTFHEFSSENFAFQQSYSSRQSYNTSFTSKPVLRESSCDVFGDIESAFPEPEQSAQGSVIEEGKERSKSEPSCPEHKITSPESRLPTAEALKDHGYSGSHNMNDNAIFQEVTAHDLEPDAEETSLPNNFQHESDDELSTPIKESQGIIPVPFLQKAKVRDAEDDNVNGCEPKTTLIDPCYQIMTVERYVLKLFSVPKGKAAVWNAVKLF